jgi:hypothetical protein
MLSQALTWLCEPLRAEERVQVREFQMQRLVVEASG